MNPALLTAFRARARTEAEALYAASVQIAIDPVASTPLPCTTSGLHKTQTLAAGAFFQQEIIVFRVRKSLLTEVDDPATNLLGKPLQWIRPGGVDPMPLTITSVNDSAELFHSIGCSAPAQ